MSIRRRMVGLCAAGAAGAAVSVQAVAPVNATTTPGEWNLASNGVDASGTSFAGSGILTFTTVTAWGPLAVTCSITGGISYTASNPTPHAAPGDTLVLQIDPPNVIAPGNGTCTDSLSGGPVNASTTAGSLWTIELDVPSGTTPSPNNGPFAGAISVPANSLRVTAVNLPGLDAGRCTLVGPTTTLTVPATYNGSTGVATKAGSAASFGLNNSLCPAAATVAQMQALSTTLWEVGATSNHPNLIYVP